MKRFATLLLATAMLAPSWGCRDLAEEVVDEAAEVVRDQKHKVIEGAQDVAIEKLDEQRDKATENAAEAISGETGEAGDGGSSDETY